MKLEELKSTDTQLEEKHNAPVVAPGEIIIGTLADINEQGQPVVNYHDGHHSDSYIALTTHALTKKQIGRQVALLFANGNPETPVIMGLIHSPLQDMLESYSTSQQTTNSEVELQPEKTVDNVEVDGERIVLKGKKEIVLKCGEASITLTRSGKVLIRGKYLLNRSSGVNRIMGGSVQVN